ncbi:MAG: acyltransferase family protein [Gammaproteobacteria bacterium]|nr:acyltransferase family protein [Gammaproteobacteria bacterium]
MTASTALPRRHDIDWLRVILFSLLIWFHFVYFQLDKEWIESSLLAAAVLDVMHQWRLAALFVISGMGTAFAFRRRTWQQYLRGRLTRLLLPLLLVTYVLQFGLFQPVQTTLDLFTVFPGIEAMPYGHLWFVYNLLIYSVLLLPVFIWLRKHPHGWLLSSVKRVLQVHRGLGLLLLPVLILWLNGLLFKPWMPGEVGMWWEFPRYLLYFACGYILLCIPTDYFAALERVRWPVTILLPILVWCYIKRDGWTDMPGVIEGGWVLKGYPALTLDSTLMTLIQALHSWSWCLFLLAWAAVLLNRPSRLLDYLNQAIFASYVVHQPLIYTIVVMLGVWALPTGVNIMLGMVMTSLTCLLVYEVVKRARFMRLGFGVQLTPQLVRYTAQQKLWSGLFFHCCTLALIVLMMWGLGTYWQFL